MKQVDCLSRKLQLTLELICLGIYTNDLSTVAGASNAIVADEDALACGTMKAITLQTSFPLGISIASLRLSLSTKLDTGHNTVDPWKRMIAASVHCHSARLRHTDCRDLNTIPQ